MLLGVSEELDTSEEPTRKGSSDLPCIGTNLYNNKKLYRCRRESEWAACYPNPPAIYPTRSHIWLIRLINLFR
jgi:hypothetical protein